MSYEHGGLPILEHFAMSQNITKLFLKVSPPTKDPKALKMITF